MHRRRFPGTLLALAIMMTMISGGAPAPAAEADLVPGEPIDYKPFAFYPDRWAAGNVSMKMVPWEGEHLVFLTTSADLDPAVMTPFVGKLNAGWELYASLTGRRPRPNRIIGDRAPIAAVPSSDLTCGVGCGYVGATGIELGKFYQADYPSLKADPAAVPHYIFYEMGRNFYTFGDRHSLFTTGFAVFMRYVCMDTLECVDIDTRTRETIEQAESVYAKSGVAFLDAFTNFGGKGEKGHRLQGPDGKPLVPSDQPVMYATAMLKLWKDHGGNDWLRSFYRHLEKCPATKPESEKAALQQSMNWFVAASCAARRDLSSLFVDRWRFPMSPEIRRQCAAIDWIAESLDAAAIVQQLTKE